MSATTTPLGVLVTGADHIWGQLMAEAVLAAPGLRDATGALRPVGTVVLVLHKAPFDAAILADPRVVCELAAITDRDAMKAITRRHGVESIFHFETVTADHDGGDEDIERTVGVNVAGSINLLEAARTMPMPTKFVFAGSCSVFEDEPPQNVNEQSRRRPTTLYGSTKAAVELVAGAYGTRGAVDARIGLLPANVSWRPSRDNQDLLHDILGAPFSGQDLVIGLDPDLPIRFNGYETCIGNLIELHDLDAGALEPSRSVLQPCVRPTLREIVDALMAAAVDRGLPSPNVIWRSDSAQQARIARFTSRIDDDWPRTLGLTPASLRDIVDRYIDDLLTLTAHARH